MRVIAAAFNHRGLERVTEVPIVFFKSHKPDFTVEEEISVIKLPEDINFAWPEVEVAMLIGENVEIKGWSVANDVTADYGADCHYLFGKAIPSFCKILIPFSSSVIPYAKMTTHLNGFLIQNGNLNDMLRGPEELVELIHSRVGLETGDIVLSGTPYHEKYQLSAGDDVEVWVEGLGTLRSKVE